MQRPLTDDASVRGLLDITILTLRGGLQGGDNFGQFEGDQFVDGFREEVEEGVGTYFSSGVVLSKLSSSSHCQKGQAPRPTKRKAPS